MVHPSTVVSEPSSSIHLPALTAQHHHHQAVPCDAQDEDEGVDHRQEDLLKLSCHQVLHTTGLLQIHTHFPRTQTRTRARII